MIVRVLDTRFKNATFAVHPLSVYLRVSGVYVRVVVSAVYVVERRRGGVWSAIIRFSRCYCTLLAFAVLLACCHDDP